MSDNTLIQEDCLRISSHISNMQFGEHDMFVYSDFNSLREIYSSHTKKCLQLRNSIEIILYHYEPKVSILNALKELDIAVEQHEADRSLIILDANELIFRPTFDSFLQYLKDLEALAIKRHGRNGIDVIQHMGVFRHHGKDEEQKLLEYETALNITCRGLKSSILCCYHIEDMKELDAFRREQVFRSHLKSYVVKKEQQ